MPSGRLGSKVRALRQRERLSQAKLAERLGISASYLNLIEHDHRRLSAPLLIKLSQLFRVDLASFAPETEARLISELMEVFGDPLFEHQALGSHEVRELATAAPGAASAVLRLYHAYRSSRESAETLASRLSEGMAFAGSDQARLPSEEVHDFIQTRGNWFPALEDAAEALWERLKLESDDLYHGLARYLRDEHGIRLRLVEAAREGGAVRRFEATARVLSLSESLPLSSRIFQVAHQIGLLTQSAVLDEITADRTLTHDESRTLGRVAMASYFAGAVLMPYRRFLNAAHEARYDIELLQSRFGVSFEQVCHRLTTLRRPGDEGIPFHFVRVDIAGNISKRFSASGIQVSRFGACPRWNLHAAFLTPGRITTQLSRTSDGRCYFCIARTVTGDARGYHAPKKVQAITLGCDVEHARKMVYADGVDLANLDAAVPIGTSCRVCERMDCEQRAFPPLQHPLRIDENIRGISFYTPVRG
jgi:predicted transcriptional regulator/transcriptional regulator with XRE-family HTH domain